MPLKNPVKATQDLVSIIIPCHNYAHLLSEALDSVLRQTYKRIEVIIINDGSNDNTNEVAAGYAKEHKQIKYVEQDNKGIVYTRNRGARIAQGDYIIQLDADDKLDENYVEKTVSLAESKGIDIVYTDAKIFGVENFVMEFMEHDIEVLKYQNYIHASSLVKRDVFEKIHYDDKLDKLGFEDWDVFLGACLAGKKAKKASGTFLHYRKHSKQISRTDTVADKKTLEARSYIFTKYMHKYPKEMLKINTVDNLIEKLNSDNRKIIQQVKQLENDNINRSNHIERIEQRLASLEKNIKKMESSKFWQLRNFYYKVKRKLTNK